MHKPVAATGARPATGYSIRQRLRTMGATALFTSLLWLAFIVLYWPRQRMPETSSAAPPAAPARIEDIQSRARLRIPIARVAPGQLVDDFTQLRGDGTRTHDAIDIMAPRGSPVLAVAAGRVEKLFLSQKGGTTLYQRSADGQTIYYYAHLDGYAPGIAEGMALSPGQTIGFVGASGDADPGAPHLHFAVMAMAPGECWWQGRAVDPYPLLGGR